MIDPRFRLVCDRCGAKSPDEGFPADLRRFQQFGWRQDSTVDLCPFCSARDRVKTRA